MAEKYKGLSMSAVMGRAIGISVAEALRLVRPVHTAKHVAGDVGAEIRTVKHWLAGNAPGAGHLAALFAKYGPAFASRVLAPCGDWTNILALEGELDVIEQRLEHAASVARSLRGNTNETGTPRGGTRLDDGGRDLRGPGPASVMAVPPAGQGVRLVGGMAQREGDAP